MSTATVVGAGVFGAATARELARRGWDVTLVEQYTPGQRPLGVGRRHAADPLRARRGGVVRAAGAARARALAASSRRRAGTRLFEPVGVAWLGTGDGIFLARASPRSGASACRASGSRPRRRDSSTRRSAATTCTRSCSSRARACIYARQATQALAHGLRVETRRIEVADPPGGDVVVWACGAWLPALFPEHVELRISRRDVFFLGVGGEWAGRPGFCDYDEGFYGHGDLGGLGMKVAPDLPGDRVDPDTLDRTPLPSNEQARARVRGEALPGARGRARDRRPRLPVHPDRRHALPRRAAPASRPLVARRRRLRPRLQARPGARRVRRRLHRGPLRAGAVPRARPARGTGEHAHDRAER